MLRERVGSTVRCAWGLITAQVSGGTARRFVARAHSSARTQRWDGTLLRKCLGSTVRCAWVLITAQVFGSTARRFVARALSSARTPQWDGTLCDGSMYGAIFFRPCPAMPLPYFGCFPYFSCGGVVVVVRICRVRACRAAGHGIGAQGVTALAEAMKVNGSATTLNLSGTSCPPLRGVRVHWMCGFLWVMGMVSRFGVWIWGCVIMNLGSWPSTTKSQCQEMHPVGVEKAKTKTTELELGDISSATGTRGVK